MTAKKNNRKHHSALHRIGILTGIVCLLSIVSAYPLYLLGENSFYSYFDKWADKLINLEKRGLLSKRLGAAWQDVLTEEAMDHEAGKIAQNSEGMASADEDKVIDGIETGDYPSLSIVARLNALQYYSNQILITDCNDSIIARIRTNHTRVRFNALPDVFVKSLVAAEDHTFWTNKGIEYGSIVRSVGLGIFNGIRHFSKPDPKGTSTITQQVAKLFISQVDASGRRKVSRTYDRKLREMRLAVALRKMYPAQAIMEVYVNHCITSDYGLVGCQDIARALFNRDLKDLSDAQCVYLSRMVKWGRNARERIVKQCEIDMPRIAKANGWSRGKQVAVLTEIQRMTFSKPQRIQTESGMLVDCANEFWMMILRNNGTSPEDMQHMDIVNPNSLMRTKGNCTIRMTISLPLQRALEHLVNARGYAPDEIEHVNGAPVPVIRQYYAYAIMDSKTGQLLAYYSKDKIGSRLSGLLKNSTPNGSSTAKPILNAINFDVGNFKPYESWNDSAEVTADVPWRRTLVRYNGKPTGVVFANSAVRGRGYEVHNHGNSFEGCKYIFDQLAASNNILGVETAYRLNQRVFNNDGSIAPEGFQLAQYFYRIGAIDRIKKDLNYTAVTGVRVYKEIARITGAEVDSVPAGNGRWQPISDSMYSIALGTLELTLYQQMHLFNALYNNDLIDQPAKHPSLVIQSITLNGNDVTINDTVTRYHPFANLNNLRPTYLGMHKRLAGPADGLSDFDIEAPDSTTAGAFAGEFKADVLPLAQSASNYAKSGTTDDVISSGDPGAKGYSKTNYGLWNATIRIDLSRLAGSGLKQPDIRDVTIACIGECNERYTGPRDGKTLHKFVSTGLLKQAGVPCRDGFYSRYESYIKRTTPEGARMCR
jgi:hypothetical protein